MKEKIKEYNIIILTDIKNMREQIFKIPGYKMIIKNNYNNNFGGAGGVAIIIRNEIKAEIMNGIITDDADIDCAGVLAKKEDRHHCSL